MSNKKVVTADLTEMVFETRDRDYGAYDIRKNGTKFLGRAAIVALALFLLGTTVPKVIYMLNPDESEYLAGKKKRLSMEDVLLLPPPPPIEEEPPPEIEPPPPPEIEQIEFKVPEPADDEEVIDTATMHEIEDLVETNVGLEDVEGDTAGYQFDFEDDGDNDVISAPPPPPEPDPFAFIAAEKPAAPVNLDEIKKLIGYPKAAKDAEIEGQVVLRILVGKNGRYKKHLVIKSAHNILTKAVEKHIHNLAFTPAIQGKQPIQLWVTIPFKFTLQR